MANFCKGIGLPTGFPIAVPCKHPKTLKKDVETAQVFFPHIMFSKLATNSSSDKLFPLDCLESFWAQAEKTDDDRLINHPLKKGKSWKKCCLPLFVHGGGVEFQSRDTIMVYSWGSPLSQKNSLCSHMYIDPWVTMWEWISWSFAALQNGYHPTHDPKGKALKKDSPFFLEKGYASKDAAPANLWYKTLEKGKPGFKKVSNEEAMKNTGSGHSLFSGMIPGLAQRWSGEIVFTYCSPSGWYHTLSLLA